MTAILANELVERLTLAAQDRKVVSGATHKFYRYPARFSPQFAAAAIDAFTNPGDLVLDPFIGGGTTAVEAMISGRRCIGTDINELALFVSKAKTTKLAGEEVEALRTWFPGFFERLKLSKADCTDSEWRDKGYFRHLEAPETWRHRNIIQTAISEIEKLPGAKQRDFMRCVLLRSMQLSLDGRRNVMTVDQVRAKVREHFEEMLDAISEMRFASSALHPPTLHKCNAGELHRLDELASGAKPKLVLTSPPYPGVHVLYHRWQVKGRRETAAPYWIANKLDGDGERYYTLGNRHEPELKTYFKNLDKIFGSLRSIVGDETTIVQMVAFSEPDWQLPQYLEIVKTNGFAELELQDHSESRIWRDVPNRKWHASRQAKRDGSREIVLVHRPD